MSFEKKQKILQKGVIHSEESLGEYVFSLSPWEKVFFYGDLGSGKSTFIRYILRKYFKNPELVVRSPTYTYYQKYELWGEDSEKLPLVYHFDLYRIEDISTLHSIGAMEIFENPNSIALIEWPELIEDFVQPTKKVSIQILEDGNRELCIEDIL